MLIRRQRGFAHLELLIILIVIAAIGAAGWQIYSKHNSKTKATTTNSATGHTGTKDDQTQGGKILPLKSIGFNLDYYNPATNRAGDMEFTHANFFDNEIIGDFGQQDPRTPDPTKRNPQPTFAMPLDVKVQSLVDGVVIKVVTLYSGDSSIMVASDLKSSYIYETEHVINVKVKVGDYVKGGQYIADVSPHGSPKEGFGILEIGLLHPSGSVAQHLCLFKYLDPSIKADIGKKLNALHEAWNTYTGGTVYPLASSYASPGCVIDGPVTG